MGHRRLQAGNETGGQGIRPRSRQDDEGQLQQGFIDFTEPVDPDGFHPIANNYKPFIGAQQWRTGTKNPVEAIVVSNATAPGTTVQDKATPMVYA